MDEGRAGFDIKDDAERRLLLGCPPQPKPKLAYNINANASPPFSHLTSPTPLPAADQSSKGTRTRMCGR